VITVFVADGCPHCEALLDDLRRRGVAAVVVNLTRQPDRVAELTALTLERRLPITVDHERCSVGFGGRSSSFSEVGLPGSPERRA
jgi:glutaredoxin